MTTISGTYFGLEQRLWHSLDLRLPSPCLARLERFFPPQTWPQLGADLTPTCSLQTQTCAYRSPGFVAQTSTPYGLSRMRLAL